MFRLHRMLAVVVAIVVCALQHKVAVAEDAHFNIPLHELQITSGELPEAEAVAAPSRKWWRLNRSAQFPWVALDGREEAYVIRGPAHDANVEGIVIRAPQAKDLRGMLAIPKADGTGMNQVKFTVAATAAKPAVRDAFHRAKLAHYERLRNLNLPGAAWFRHQASEARQSLGEPIPAGIAPRDRFRSRNDFELIENAGTLARYERQLGLSLSDLPDDLIASLAPISTIAPARTWAVPEAPSGARESPKAYPG